MKDVRNTLWKAYKQLESSTNGIEGRLSEGWCELKYPTYLNCETPDEFCEPYGLIVYSYALGTSRMHLFNRGAIDRQVNYYTWEAPDFYAKAVEVINEWANNI